MYNLKFVRSPEAIWIIQKIDGLEYWSMHPIKQAQDWINEC